MKKYFIIVNSELKYTIEVTTENDAETYILKTSNSERWCSDFRNKEVLSITNDGNCFKMNKGKKFANNHIEYLDFEELWLMLNFIRNNDNPFKDKYYITKDEGVVENYIQEVN